ncbi:MAG: DegV family protein [Clostridiales bacterium]|nr:DegV family protein [Clostridiales bacterium]
MLKLFTDTDCDVTPKVAAEYGYSLISMPYAIDGKTVFPYEDFLEFDPKAFYDQLRGGVLPNTSAISREKYYEIFEPYFVNGDEILYVHFSRAMTATFDAMDQAIADLSEKYPAAKFYEIDTKGITIVSYNIVREVGDMVKAGKTVEEILKWAETEVDKFATYFFADDLKFFKHSGRVSGLAATMGTLLGVRPIICMNEEGKMVSVGKERGRAKAIDRLLAYVDELGEDLKDHRVIIGNADAEEIADEIEARLRAKYEGLTIERISVNPTAGSHCGPNTVGVCFHAKHR